MKRFLDAVGRLAILLVACGAVFGLGSWFVLRGQQLENARLENTLYGLQNKVNEGRAAERARPLYREELERFELELEARLSGVPAGGGISELYSELRRIGRLSGVTLQQRAPSVGDDGSENAAQITVRGKARQMLAFLAALGDDAYPFVADDLRLYPVEGTDDVQADLVVTSPLGSP